MKLNPSTSEMLHVLGNLRAQSLEELEAVSSVTEFWTLLMSVNGHHWVGFAGKEPAALIGAYQISGPTWGMYGFGTDRWGEIWRDVTRTARKEIISTAERVGATRAECLSMTSHTQTHGWLRLVGLEPEQVFSNYGRNGQSYTMFAWNKEVPNVHLQKPNG